MNLPAAAPFCCSPCWRAEAGVVRRRRNRDWLSLRRYRPYVRSMPRPKPEEFDKKKVVAENRRARFDYAIEDKFEAGVAANGGQGERFGLRAGPIARRDSAGEGGGGWVVKTNNPPFRPGQPPKHEAQP